MLRWRAERKAEEEGAKGSGGQTLVICYNKTLEKFASDTLALNGAPSTVRAKTFLSWAYQHLKQHDARPNVIGDQQPELIHQVLADSMRGGVRSSLLRRPVKWWQEEIAWIKGQLIETWEAYEVVDRKGRGTGLPGPARRVVWEVFEGYERALREKGKMDYRDYARRLLALWSRMPQHPRVAHVLVDEAQDLYLADLRVLKYLSRDSFTVAADRQQKIYPTRFNWKDLEEGTPFTSIFLKSSYRTTRPVAALAARLSIKDTLVQRGDFDFGAGELPDKPGPRPALLDVADARQEEAVMLRLLAHLAHTHGGRSVGLLAYHWSTLEQAKIALDRHRIPCEFIKDREGSAVTPGVKLTTLHSAKGLEFGDVILIGLTEGLFPPPVAAEVAIKEGESDEDFITTARRLLYVAMTRTRRGLYLLHRPPATRFLAELDPSLYTTTVPEIADVVTAPPVYATQPAYVPGTGHSSANDVPFNDDDIPF